MGDLINRSMLLENLELLAKFQQECKQSTILGVCATIRATPAVDAEPVRHGKWKHVKRHMWHRNKNGEIDEWAMEYEFHNGPVCEVCGCSICVHCSPDWENEECKIGYFICSECKQSTRSTTQYCPNCGAKMDKEVEK